MNRQFLIKLARKCALIFAAVLTAVALTVDKSVKCAVEQREVVFISSTVARIERIVDDLPRHADVVYLPEGDDAILRITRYLTRRRDIATLRLITHGAPGCLVLNGEMIDQAWLVHRREWIESWKNALTEDADILLYACCTAANAEGRRLVRTLSEFTGADVAASTNRTGGVENEWALEYTTGHIETPFLEVKAYPYYLADQLVTNNNDSGVGSLRQAIADVGEGEEITFNNDYTITLTTGELTINRNLTINGAGHTILINGNNGSRVFCITSGTVTIENMILQNGNVALAKGGGIYNDGNLSLSGCTVTGNSSGLYGGGIYNGSGATISITNSTISDNTPSNTSGGGIYNDGGTVNLYGTNTFTGNTSSNNGDAIYNASGTLNLNDSMLYMSEDNPLYNEGTFSAGTSTVVLNRGSIQTFAFTPSFFGLELTSGTVFKYSLGGTITISGETSGQGTVELSGSSHVTYSGTCDQTVFSGTYGHLNLSGSSSTKTFADGTTTVQHEINLTDTLTLTGSSNNNVTVQVVTPGASNYRVFNMNASGKTIHIENITIKGGDISGNGEDPSGYGGAIYVAAGTLYLDQVTVSSSKAHNGGGIYNAGNTATITDSTITDNAAKNEGYVEPNCGGGLYGAFNIRNSTISGNSVTATVIIGAGDDVYAYGAGIYATGDTTILNSTVGGNNAEATVEGREDGEEAYAYGGGVYIGSGTVNIVNSTIFSNQANAEEGTDPSAYGGGISNGGGTVHMLNAIVVNNTLDGDTIEGDDIYGTVTGYYCWSPNAISGDNNNTTSYASDLNGLFYNGGFTNTAAVTSSGNASNKAGSGTDAYYNSTDGYYYWNTIEENYIKISDGGLADNPSANDIISTDQRGYYRNDYEPRTVTRGAYQYDGVFAKKGAVSWDSEYTYSNWADAIGGCGTGGVDFMYLIGTAILTEGITINKSLDIDGQPDDSTILQADITPGTASDRVFNITSGTVTLEDMTIRNGNVSGDGGGISNAATLTITNCTISENTATGGSYGCGGVCNSGTLTLTNSTVSSNTASVSGGAYGGGICGAGSGETVLTNCTISGNEATDNGNGTGALGGGISVFGAGGITLANCTISGNAATSSAALGAGFYLQLGTANVKNTIMAQNVDNSSNYDYCYAAGTLTDGGYNVVEYQMASEIDPDKTFISATDILYNYKKSSPPSPPYHWNINDADIDGALNLSTTLALNDSTNGTYTLALGEGSFAAASSTTGIPPASNWNNSPQIDGAYVDQRGVARSANQNTSIGAYSANYVPSAYYYRSNGNVNWTTTTNWEQSVNQSNWDAAAGVPDESSLGITINNTATVNTDVTIDQITVASGATLSVDSDKTLTIADGSGNDLTVEGTGTVDVNGTLDASAAQIVFSGEGALNLVQNSFSVNSFTAGSSTVTLDGGVPQTIAGDMVLNNLSLAADTVLTTTHNITVSGETSGTGTVNASNGTFTYNRIGNQTLFSGTLYNLTTSGSGTKTLTGGATVTNDLTIDGGVTLDVNGNNPLTVKNIFLTNGTVDLSGLNANLLVGGNLVISSGGTWVKHGSPDDCVQFTGSACTFTDNSSGGPQNLGHVKVDE